MVILHVSQLKTDKILTKKTDKYIVEEFFIKSLHKVKIAGILISVVKSDNLEVKLLALSSSG